MVIVVCPDFCNINIIVQRRLLQYNPSATSSTHELKNTDNVGNNMYMISPKTQAPKFVWSCLDESGERVLIKPKESMWYAMYVNNPLITSNASMRSKFRVHFCLPYKNYLKLVEWCHNNYWFERWCRLKKNNKKASPIELFVLGALHYLGCGFTSDDIEKCTAIVCKVHRVFLQQFVEYSWHVLHPKFVHFPKPASDAETHMIKPVCVSSSNYTHIAMERCKYALQNQHIGQKSSHPTRSFNMTVNHCCRIIYSSMGGLGSWNDQTSLTWQFCELLSNCW